MDIYNLAQSLQKRYNPRNARIFLHKNREKYLSECIIPSNVFVYSGQGATLQTNIGEFTDLSSMTVNCILGQNDPWINANLIAYLYSGRPSFLTTRLGNEVYYKVAKRILEVVGKKDAVINHRQCNGTDVTELAILAAYNHRRKDQSILVSFDNSYHGQGLMAYLMSGLQSKHRFLIDANDSPVLFLPAPSHASDIENQPLSPCDKESLEQLNLMKDRIFAVILEPIQVNNAVNIPSKQFFQALRKICDKGRIPLIFDEVQTGFGWLGKITASERFGVWPNLLAVSKALTAGNGPLAALVSDKIYQDIEEGTGAKTNGADIRSLIACNALIDRLVGIPADQIPGSVDEQLYEELKVGLLSSFYSRQKMLLYFLENLRRKSKGLFGVIKGDGLIRGLEVKNSKGEFDCEFTGKLQLELLYNGVLVRHSKHTLIFKPPLVISEREMEKGFNKVIKIITRYI